MTVIMRFLIDLFPHCESFAASAHPRRPLAGRPRLSGDEEPAAEVDLVQVEQFGVALGPPARFEIGAQLAYYPLLDGAADLVPDRDRAPDPLVQVRLRPPPVGGEVAVAAVPGDGYRLQAGADRAGPFGQRRPAGAQLRVLGHVVADQPEVPFETADVEMKGDDAAGDAPHLPVAGDNVRPVLVGRRGHRGVE